MYYKNIKIKSQGHAKSYDAADYFQAGLQIYNWIEAHKIVDEDGVYQINPDGPIDLTGGPVHGKNSLYSGSAGIGTLLIRFYETTGEGHFLEEAKEVAGQLIASTPGPEFYKEKYESALNSSLKVVGWHTGVYSGPVGAGIFILQLYKYVQNPEYLEFAKRLAEDFWITGTSVNLGADRDTNRNEGTSSDDGTDLNQNIASDDDTDLKWQEDLKIGITFTCDTDVFSDGGFVLYLISLYKVTKDTEYLRKAREIAAYIFSKRIVAEDGGFYWDANVLERVGMPKDSIYPGFAHGTAGIGYLFAALYEQDRREWELLAAEEAARFMESIADEAGEGLLTPYLYGGQSTEEWKQKYYIGFCHGPAGVSLLFRLLYKITGNVHYDEIMLKLAEGIVEAGAPEYNSWGFWNSYCFCCGAPGLVEYFTDLYEYTGMEKHKEYAIRSAARVLGDSFVDGDERKFFGHWDRTDPRGVETYTGFYIGAAGAAAALLRLYANEKKQKVTDAFEYSYLK